MSRCCKTPWVPLLVSKVPRPIIPMGLCSFTLNLIHSLNRFKTLVHKITHGYIYLETSVFVKSLKFRHIFCTVWHISLESLWLCIFQVSKPGNLKYAYSIKVHYDLFLYMAWTKVWNLKYEYLWDKTCTQLYMLNNLTYLTNVINDLVFTYICPS